jgi:hydroxyquinol 1,2-dioxygenase
VREFDEATITDAVLERVAGTREPRLLQVSQALVKHLHAFIREIEPTQAEWQWGIRFLTETGQLCSDTRQEFILLSDTLGVSMLVDAINHRLPSGATETTVLGPFYAPPPEFEPGDDIRGHLNGRPMYVAGRVTNADGRPLADAVVDVWHSDDQGFYDLQKFDNNPRYAGRGRFRTGEDGRFRFWTIRPSAYPIPDDGSVGKMLRAQNRHPFRPEHIHFMVVAPGHRKLVTHIFAAGDQYLDSDAVFGVKKSLVEEYRAHHRGTAPDGRAMDGDWFSLDREFRLAALG